MAQRVSPDRNGLINIGKIKENLVTEVELPAPGLGGGTYAVMFKRPKEEQPYPVAARLDGSSLIWTVHAADTAASGTGRLECRWYGENGEVAKGQTYMVRITAGLPDQTVPPDGWEGYIGQVSRDAQAAKNAASVAEKAAELVKDTNIRVEDAEEAAQKAMSNADAAAESAAIAERYSNLAQQSAAEKGWMYVDGEADGHLYLYTSDNLDMPELKDENGRLIAIYGET